MFRVFCFLQVLGNLGVQDLVLRHGCWKTPHIALQHGRLWACRIAALGWTVSGDGLRPKVQFLSST